MAAIRSHLPLVAVVGGAGYIGSCLVRQLLADGYPVRVFDNFLFGRSGLEDLDHPALEILHGDICDTRAISHALTGADIVVLLAAIVGHRAKELRWTSAREVNFLGSTVVLDAAIEHGASRFIFASTDSVYGVQQGMMYETATPEPVSLYSRLKLRMEARVISEKTKSFHPTSLRVSTCYGYSHRMRFDLVVNALVRDAIFKKELIIQNGELCRALIHVEDAARAFLLCIKAHENLVSGEIFNVTAKGQTLQLNQMLNILKTVVPDTTVKILQGEPDLVNYHLSSSKIEKVLDFSAQHNIKESMEDLRDRLRAGEFSDPYSFRYNNTWVGDSPI